MLPFLLMQIFLGNLTVNWDKLTVDNTSLYVDLLMNDRELYSLKYYSINNAAIDNACNLVKTLRNINSAFNMKRLKIAWCADGRPRLILCASYVNF
ncbi:hypothetical protein MAR_033395 [Mya arenaria]|uniref:Uncharacterized protein n=1 Tax=Mya arenaria TaxID=6604 RepID=A0ABY7G8X1_MYAAR|nr:hypothetical protein MAR_033395 [Mya arenaria]